MKTDLLGKPARDRLKKYCLKTLRSKERLHQYLQTGARSMLQRLSDRGTLRLPLSSPETFTLLRFLATHPEATRESNLLFFVHLESSDPVIAGAAAAALSLTLNPRTLSILESTIHGSTVSSEVRQRLVSAVTAAPSPQKLGIDWLRTVLRLAESESEEPGTYAMAADGLMRLATDSDASQPLRKKAKEGLTRLIDSGRLSPDHVHDLEECINEFASAS